VGIGWKLSQEAHYSRIGEMKSSLRWTVALILKLWQVAWNMWEHRNSIEDKNEFNDNIT
jgi:hypothetical protein